MRRFRWFLSLFAASTLLAAGPLERGRAAAAGSGERFVPGTGAASARVSRLTLRSSGAAVAVGIGAAKARYQGSQGNASAAGLDLGLLGMALTTPFACGRTPAAYFPDGVPPEPITVSSGDGPVSQRSAAAGSGTPVEILSQEGSAAPNSEAVATVAGVTLDLAGVVTVAGGTATSTARPTPGARRDATARSEIGSLSLAGGMVRLGGLVWTAVHRSGAEPDSAGAFSVGAISLADADLPTGDSASLAESLEQVNGALAPLGVALHLPTVIKAGDETQVTPLRLSVNANPALRTVIGPALAAAQPARSALLELAKPFGWGENCGLQTGLGFGFLVLDLFMVFFGDQGGIDIDLGGARAGTDGIAYANPFGSGFGAITPGPLTATPSPATPSLPTTPSSPPPGAAVTPAPPLPPPAAPPPPAPTAAEPAPPPSVTQLASPVERFGERFCRSSHPRRRGGCSEERSAAVVAGWLALVVAAGLATADRIRLRRARPQLTSEVTP